MPVQASYGSWSNSCSLQNTDLIPGDEKIFSITGSSPATSIGC